MRRSMLFLSAVRDRTRVLCFLLFAGWVSGWAGSRLVPIDAVVVTGTRHVDLVRGQFRIQEGQAYTEDALWRAVNRVVRLPFVRDAHLSLSRGTRHGTYTVTLAVDTWENLTYLWTTEHERHPRLDTDEGADNLDIGYRVFLGRHGMVFAGIAPATDLRGDDDGLDLYRAGYAHYNLFGRGVFASVTVNAAEGYTFTFFDPDARIKSDPIVQPVVQVGVPLAGDYWLRATYQDTRLHWTDAATETLDLDIVDTQWQLFVEYNTTDDVFLPTTGRLWTAGVSLSDGGFRAGLEGERLLDADDRTLQPAVSYTGYHRFRDRHSLGYTLSAAYDDVRADAAGGFFEDDEEPRAPGEDHTTRWDLSARMAYSADLWGRRMTQRTGDLRLLLEGGYRWADLRERHSTTDIEGMPVSFEDRSRGHEAHVSATLAFRHGWGAVRLSYRYVFDAEPINDIGGFL